MKRCQYCGARFVNEDAYQIHLGVGAPAFHTCHDAGEMQAEGMTQNGTGQWQIDESLIVHQDKEKHLQYWARLKSRLAVPGDWE